MALIIIAGGVLMYLLSRNAGTKNAGKVMALVGSGVFVLSFFLPLGIFGIGVFSGKLSKPVSVEDNKSMESEANLRYLNEQEGSPSKWEWLIDLEGFAPDSEVTVEREMFFANPEGDTKEKNETFIIGPTNGRGDYELREGHNFTWPADVESGSGDYYFTDEEGNDASFEVSFP